ncbi:hypothetical protein Pd630_LPD03844 [Rhodococcus opacus PD630]|nr:hypothetical protein Pd630_LPD03844 [Rhodococcus opacus PD630]
MTASSTTPGGCGASADSLGITPTELECYRLNFPPGRNRGQGEELSVERSTFCVFARRHSTTTSFSSTN